MSVDVELISVFILAVMGWIVSHPPNSWGGVLSKCSTGVNPGAGSAWLCGLKRGLSLHPQRPFLLSPRSPQVAFCGIWVAIIPFTFAVPDSILGSFVRAFLRPDRTGPEGRETSQCDLKWPPLLPQIMEISVVYCCFWVWAQPVAAVDRALGLLRTEVADCSWPPPLSSSPVSTSHCPFFSSYYIFEIQCIFYTYRKSELGLATFQLLSHPMWPMATVLDSTVWVIFVCLFCHYRKRYDRIILWLRIYRLLFLSSFPFYLCKSSCYTILY